MTLRPAYSLINSEFNEFLFAPVGEEKNGMMLSVISALARLDIDPWGEAALLSDLSREKAAQALVSIIARLPGGRWAIADIPTIAARLVEFLPRSKPAASAAAQAVAAPGVAQAAKVRSRTAYVIYLAIVATVYFTLIAQHQSPPAKDGAPTQTSDSTH